MLADVIKRHGGAAGQGSHNRRIAGLSTAYSLIEHSRLKGVKDPHITIIEKSANLGGNIKTERLTGFSWRAGLIVFFRKSPGQWNS